MRGLAGDGRRVLGERFAAARRRDDGVDDAFLEFLPHRDMLRSLSTIFGKVSIT